MASAFPLFLALPLEIRFSIWELTFTPRVIFLFYERVERADFHNYPTFVPTAKFPRPWHFFIDDNDMSPIAALSVAKESRSFAMSKGYRTWKLRSISDETACKDVMWNPAVDTISCRGGSHKPVPTRAFAEQFPAETKALRYLALPSNYWSEYWDENKEFVDSFVAFESLGEICVVIAVASEFSRVTVARMVQRKGHAAPPAWPVPENIQNDPLRLRTLQLDGKIPEVRVVDCADDILCGDSRKLVLRCYPCPDLYEIVQDKLQKRI